MEVHCLHGKLLIRDLGDDTKKEPIAIMRPFRVRQGDIVAGLTGAVAGAPQAMGFALVAGVNPLYGLYTAVVSTIVGALVGKSSFMTIGPTNALSLVVASALGGYSGAAQADRLFVLTILVGIFFLIFGFLNLGFLVRFVSNAVMTGFITGAGLLIMLGQIQHITGYTAHGDNALIRLGDWFLHLHHSNIPTVIIGIAAISIIVAIHKTRFSNFATLVAILVTTIIVIILNWSDVEIVRSISSIPRGLPLPIIPDLSHGLDLIPIALAMSVLGAVQSTAITTNIPERDGTPADTNRDLIGMGFANFTAGIFQGMPSCGSLSRTAVNIHSGAETRWSNVWSGVFVGGFIALFGTLVEVIPLAALAGHLVVAAASLISLDQIKLVWRVNQQARLAMVATFISTLVLPLEFSVYIGVVLSLAMYVYSASEQLHVIHLQPIGSHRYRALEMPKALPSNDITIFSIHGHLYFAAVRKLEKLLPEAGSTIGTIVILRLRENDYLGSTGIQFLRKYRNSLEKKDGKLLLSGVSPTVHKELERTTFEQEFGKENIFYSSDIFFESTEQAYQYATSLLVKVPVVQS